MKGWRTNRNLEQRDMNRILSRPSFSQQVLSIRSFRSDAQTEKVTTSSATATLCSLQCPGPVMAEPLQDENSRFRMKTHGSFSAITGGSSEENNTIGPFL